jgi:hypothetical protein
MDKKLRIGSWRKGSSAGGLDQANTIIGRLDGMSMVLPDASLIGCTQDLIVPHPKLL